MNFNIENFHYWIFDMDGTLTVPIHDFAAIRKELEIPLEEDILGFIDSLPSDESERKHKQLRQIELDLAHRTEPQPQVTNFLQHLTDKGCHMGIITRNTLENTYVTLESAGLSHFFSKENILTRECAAPKPAPDAIHQLLSHWSGEESKAIIAGDYKHDLHAGQNAGIHTLYFDSKNTHDWDDLADFRIASWSELL